MEVDPKRERGATVSTPKEGAAGEVTMRYQDPRTVNGGFL